MLNIQHIAVSQLKVNPKNPRVIKDDAFGRLARVSKKTPIF